MIVVFVFLQGFRATIIPMLAIPVSLVATFAVMAAFGFSINSLTLCGLILAIGLVVDDAIIVVENVEKYLHRGLPPAGGHPRRDGRDHHADRDDHPGAGRRVRPRGVHAGDDREAVQPVRDDDRLLVRVLGVQLALVQPGDVAAVPPREARRDPVLPVPLVQRGAGLDREFLRRGARMDGPPLVDDRRAVGGPAGAHRLDDRQPAQGVHPDRGPGLPDLRGPDSRRHQRREDRRGHPARRGALPGRGGGQAHGRARGPERDHLDQPDQLRRRLRPAGGLARAQDAGAAGRRAGPEAPGRRSPRSATPW